MRSPSFFLLILLVYIFSQIGLAGRLSAWLRLSRKSAKIAMGAVFLLCSLEMGGHFLSRVYHQEFQLYPAIGYCLYSLIGLQATLLFYYLVLEICRIFLSFGQRNESEKLRFNRDRRLFLSLGGASIASFATGVAQASEPMVRNVRIPIPGLPKEFADFKIVQISDLHLGPLIGKSYTDRVVELTNRLEPDIITLTGDIGDGPVSDLQPELASLKNLRAKEGIFYCTGNHEYYWGIEEWLQTFRELGFTVLLNEHQILAKGSAKIALGGVTDFSAYRYNSAHQSSATKAFLGVPEAVTKILMAHQPASYKDSAAAQVDLQLSGHTHGGQFFPWNILVALVQPFYKGLNKYGKMWIYTSTGTGYWGPPTRFCIPSEIALIRLTAEEGENLQT